MIDTPRNEAQHDIDRTLTSEIPDRFSLVSLTAGNQAPIEAINLKADANVGAKNFLPNLSIDPVTERPQQERTPNRGERQGASLNPSLGQAHAEQHGLPTIHAPELAAVRHNTTHFNSSNGVLSWGFENGAIITQHTQGHLTGAQVLQDGSGRVLRLQEPPSANAPGRPPREIEFQYPQGQTGQIQAPSAAVIRNAQTGEVIQTIRAGNDTNISVHAGGFTVESNGVRKGNQLHTITNYDLSGTETSESIHNGPFGRFSTSTMTQTISENQTTADGIALPRGSLMSTTWFDNGQSSTVVRRPNGQVDHYSSTGANQPRSWQSSVYDNPTNLEYNVNGQNQTFPGIRSAHLDKMNGTLQLEGQGGIWTLTCGQNGNITAAEFKPSK